MKLDKPGGFLGHKALVEAKAKPLTRRLVSMVLDDREPLLWGGEALLRDGRPVGDLTSAGYGHSVGASVGLGYVRREDGPAIDAAWLDGGKFEVDLAGTRLRAKVALRCPSIRRAPESKASDATPRTGRTGVIIQLVHARILRAHTRIHCAKIMSAKEARSSDHGLANARSSGSRHQGLGFLEAGVGELAGGLEDRIGDRSGGR